MSGRTHDLCLNGLYFICESPDPRGCRDGRRGGLHGYRTFGDFGLPSHGIPCELSDLHRAGLGDNAFFTYSVVLAMGMPWQQAMAGVFIASILFTVVSIFRIREIIIDAIPQDLKYAMAAGIGIFISFVGLQGGGIVIADPASIISIGSFKVPTTWLTIFGTL